jgi:hypothetical protein
MMAEIDKNLLTVGALGHRTIEQPDVIIRAVDQALDMIMSAFKATKITVVSSLAEGADRLIARRCMALPDSKLIAALPLPAEEYSQDFISPASVQEFQSLLNDADDVIVLSTGGDRLEAYRKAGAYLVDSCSVLVAIWDGLRARGPGGTADTVKLARNRNLPLAWIYSPPPGTTTVRTPAPRNAGDLTLERLPDLPEHLSKKE